MNAKEIISSTIAQARKEIEAITAELNAPVLDGTPWMIFTDEAHGMRILGEWPSWTDGVTTKGYLHISAVPGHACGAYMLSKETADAWIKNAKSTGMSVGKMHVREFKKDRVDELQALITSMENL